MPFRIVVTPEARDQLYAIYTYIAAEASPDIAERFTNGILDHLAPLTDYPLIVEAARPRRRPISRQLTPWRLP